MDPSRGDSRYNLNYSMSSIGLSLADQADMYGNPAAVAALGGRPPSGGLIQTMGGAGTGVGGGFGARSGSLMPNTTQCQSLGNSAANSAAAASQQQQQQQQQRGIKRAGSDCYEDHHRGGSAVMTAQSLQGLESCAAGGNGQQSSQQQQASGSVPDVVDDSYNTLQNKKSPPANGKKTKGRVKIKMEYIDNKLRRYTTFSKRKTGIMKKAYELSTLTGTQVMLLVASETGHVYTFATRKLQPMITSEAGKQLIQTCLNSPDPPSVGGGDQRMSATGFEETELSYNIADEDSKDDRSPLSSGAESDDSSDIDSPGPGPGSGTANAVTTTVASANNCKTSQLADGSSLETTTAANASCNNNEHLPQYEQRTIHAMESKSAAYHQSLKTPVLPAQEPQHQASSSSSNVATTTTASAGLGATTSTARNNLVYPASALSNVPQEVLLQLIQSGHLQLHTEEDGSGHQYVAIPLSSSTVNLIKGNNKSSTGEMAELKDFSNRSAAKEKKQQPTKTTCTTNIAEMSIKQELE